MTKMSMGLAYGVQEGTVGPTWSLIGVMQRNFFCVGVRWIYFVPGLILWAKDGGGGSNFLPGLVWGYLASWSVWARMLCMDMILGIYATIWWCKIWKIWIWWEVMMVWSSMDKKSFKTLSNPPWYVSHWNPLIERNPTIYGFVYIGHIGRDMHWNALEMFGKRCNNRRYKLCDK